LEVGSNGPVLGGCQGSAEAALVALVRAFEPGEPSDVGVDAGLLQHQRIAGGEGLDLGEGQGLVADVVDVTVRKVAAGHLSDEGRLSFEGLPSPNFARAIPRLIGGVGVGVSGWRAGRRRFGRRCGRHVVRGDPSMIRVLVVGEGL
jgi:hypothetical protein